MGDRYLQEQQYDAAIAAYDRALLHKDDVYPRDQILRAKAEKYRMEKAKTEIEQEQLARQREEAEARRLLEVYAVQFTGLLISDHNVPNRASEINNRADACSDFLLPGKYDNLSTVLHKAHNSSLDGICVPAGARLVVYSEPGCTGRVLLDVTGPAIIGNGIWKDDKRYRDADTETFRPELEAVYPPSVRSWSQNDMHKWINGSLWITVK
jgi:hypothetical protein